MQLQRSLDEITRQGLGLAAISYDAPEVLRAFSERHGITFPLLSDEGSKTITAWGLLNREVRPDRVPLSWSIALSPIEP